MTAPQPAPHPNSLRLVVILTAAIAAVVGAIELLTHVIAPRLLTHYESFPALAAVPKRTTNARGVPGDPLNIVLVGSASEVAEAFRLAGWTAAEPVTRRSSIQLGESVLLHRPDSAAPMSSLYLFGRMQDLAFEREVGPSASRRHHIRLWQVANAQHDGRSIWLGGATFDLRAGISHRGLHPTHHIAPDVDEERDTLAADLTRAGQVVRMSRVTGVGVSVDARNAEGDRFDTDGEMRVLVLSPGNAVHAAPTDAMVPWPVRVKDRIWSWFHRH